MRRWGLRGREHTFCEEDTVKDDAALRVDSVRCEADMPLRVDSVRCETDECFRLYSNQVAYY